MDIKTYFNSLAEHWDRETEPIDDARRSIVFLSEIGEDTCVLDVACGTGAMFEAYKEKNVQHVSAIDLSEKMAEQAARKTRGDDRFEVRCKDLFQIQGEIYDCVMIYNAYPHFMEKENLVRKAAELLKPDGRVTIAHGAGKEVINLHHGEVPVEITSQLRSAKEESQIWKDFFRIDILIDTPGFYMFSGKKL